MVGFQHFQLGHLNVQLHLFFDTGIAGCQHFDLGIGEGGGIHILDGARRGFPGHNLSDELLFILHQPPVIGVKGALGDIAEDFHLLVVVAAPHDPSGPLLQISGAPRTIKVMGGNKPLLHVGSGAHFLCTAQQDAHLTIAHLGEQLRLLRIGIGIMDKGDFLRWHSFGDQLGTNIIIYAHFQLNALGIFLYRVRVLTHHFFNNLPYLGLAGFLAFRFPFWRGKVAKHKLRTLGGCAFLPNLKHIFDTGVDLTVGVISQQGIHQSLV